MFTEIVDIDKAWELYQAGLLWELYYLPHCSPEPARNWASREHMHHCSAPFSLYPFKFFCAVGGIICDPR